MATKLKSINNKFLNILLVVLLTCALTTAILSAKELRGNWIYASDKSIYLDSGFSGNLSHYSYLVSDFARYYKSEEYINDKNNITDGDRQVCKNEIEKKKSEEIEKLRETILYTNDSDESQDAKQKKFDEESAKVKEKYTMTDEQMIDYILNRKKNSYATLVSEIESYKNFKHMAYDKVTNKWYGATGINFEDAIKSSSFAIEIEMWDTGDVVNNVYISGKKYTKLENIHKYGNSSYGSKYGSGGDSYFGDSTYSNNGGYPIKIYVWMPKGVVTGGPIASVVDNIKENTKLFFRNCIVFGLALIISIVLMYSIARVNERLDINKWLYSKIRKLATEYKIGMLLINYIVWHMVIHYIYWSSGYVSFISVYNFINTFILVFISYFIVHVLITDYKEKNLFTNNVSTKLINGFKEGSQRGSIFRTIIWYIFLYGVIGFGLLAIAIISGGVLFPICFIVGIVMTFGIVILGIRKLSYLNKIIVGAKNVAEGRLNAPIEEKGHGHFTGLAHNINHIKDGLRMSIQNEVKSEKMKTELITNVSHDLKTPLTSIINYIDLLKREELQPEAARDYVEVLDNKAQRLRSLIEDLFEASKATSGSLQLNLEKIDIVQLLMQALGENNEKFEETNLELRTNLPEYKIFVNGDGRRLYRIFENLITNISKYSLNNSRVYVDVTTVDDNVKIVMKNVSYYELTFNPNEITERFKRGDESRTTEGSGLGLAIVKGLVQRHGGQFRVEVDGDLFKSIITLKKLQED